MGCTPSIHVSQTGVVYCRESDDSNSPRPSALSSATFHTHVVSRGRDGGGGEGPPALEPPGGTSSSGRGSGSGKGKKKELLQKGAVLAIESSSSSTSGAPPSSAAEDHLAKVCLDLLSVLSCLGVS
ncbi:hypothetical protein V1264_001805 [Littorina saxatilis]|uniref:Uncharacterized protein n=2 Tax=Littorina saxatilis TaxID=31220 RepID=A0AAN9C084_9CAEN